MSIKTTVLIVDDSSIMRHLITDIIQEDQELLVIDTANNGLDAVNKVRERKPDIVILDLQMGEYDGYYAVKNIMHENPTPILILSALGNSDFKSVLKCLNAGAIDYVNKPIKNNTKLREINKQIINKVKAVSKVKLLEKEEQTALNTHHHTFSDTKKYEIMVIGASTGGPSAVEAVITKLPGNLNIPVVIVQHMPHNFIESFVSRLNTLTPLNVRVAISGTNIENGFIYVAPGNKNLTVRINSRGDKVFSATNKLYKEYNHPSIDALFLSSAEYFGNKTIGVILTGMGKDGALGLLELSNAGALTVVQDEKTSVVYGMPKEAKNKGKAQYQLPIQEVGPFIISALS